MRPELELIQKIEQYPQGELSAADKTVFEEQMASDNSLREAVKLHMDILRGLRGSR